MARGKRRKDGGPEFALQYVHTLASIFQIHVTRKARDEAAVLLPPSLATPVAAMRQTILALREAHWKFAEENDTGCVDVYRIVRYGRPIWVKIKVEARNAKDHVILISFHDYDDDVPI
jgi:hypothetical protein